MSDSNGRMNFQMLKFMRSDSSHVSPGSSVRSPEETNRYDRYSFDYGDGLFSENDNEQTSRLVFGSRELEDETDERCSLGDATEEQSATESILCSVCGDVVAGFHCGAYVCEACKKFFVRCLKQDNGQKFTCAQNKNCTITKTTRTQCPYCRYQKCLALGMYSPGGPNISSEICHIPCKVCGAPSSGFHFGAITCEGCKGFFRRTVKERDSLKYQCSRNGSCVITWKTRNICKMCRFQQCLKVGMKPEKSRIGRQPNKVKHATLLELHQIKMAKGIPVAPFPACEIKSECEEEIEDFEACSSMPAQPDIDFSMATSSKIPAGRKRSKTFGNAGSPAAAMRPMPKIKRENHSNENSPSVFQDEGLLALSELDMIAGSSFSGRHWLARGDRSAGQTGYEMQLPPMSIQNSAENGSGWSKFDQSVPGTNNCREYFPGGKHSSEAQRNIENSACNVNSPSKWPADYNRMHECQNGSNNLSSLSNVDKDYKMASSSSAQSNVVKQIQDGYGVGQQTLPQAMSPMPNYEVVIDIMRSSFRFLTPILTRCNTSEIMPDSSLEEIWDLQMNQFAQCAQAILAFAKKVPGFRKCLLSDQIEMVQSCMFPIVLVILALVYDVENSRFSYFSFSNVEQELILQTFEPFQCLVPTFHKLGHMIRKLDPDETEVSFLCALHLVDTGNKHTFKELLIDSLEHYTSEKYGPGRNRHLFILMCLRDMSDANQVHLKSLENFLQHPRFSQLPIPQLFKESFISLDN